MNSAESASSLDEATLEFTVNRSDSLKEGDTLIIRRISSHPAGVRIEAVPEKAVRAAVARLLG